ncbi:YT521-B-like domain-containing protein [Lipomyces orientalis]|uniref:YT521-B-like domain-containing protein n=1 Tax=Lipomyces orientalis TaxID=1233043 RepID=A0ACC3TPN2_9ASCO
MASSVAAAATAGQDSAPRANHPSSASAPTPSSSDPTPESSAQPTPPQQQHQRQQPAIAPAWQQQHSRPTPSHQHRAQTSTMAPMGPMGPPLSIPLPPTSFINYPYYPVYSPTVMHPPAPPPGSSVPGATVVPGQATASPHQGVISTSGPGSQPGGPGGQSQQSGPLPPQFIPYGSFPQSPTAYYPGMPPYAQMIPQTIPQSPRAGNSAPGAPSVLQQRGAQPMHGRFGRRQSSVTDPFMPATLVDQQQQQQQLGRPQGQPPPQQALYSFPPPLLPSLGNPFLAQMMQQPQPHHHHNHPHHYHHRQHISQPSTSSTTSTSSAVLPRGPPRKPKQSGHALWVGNLPLVTTVLDLRDMFASPAIESVFLISKSNCAFVNYSSDMAVRDALDKFKRFGGLLKGTKLVARMQRGSIADRTAPTHGDDGTETASVAGEPGTSPQPRTHRPEAFFVVKSLTVEDLDLSVQTGVWATQAHNEHVLNDAYNSVDNVYLIFSANKSGEYFGYARMAGPIVREEQSEESSKQENGNTEENPEQQPAEVEEDEDEPVVSGTSSDVSSAPTTAASSVAALIVQQQQQSTDLPKTTYTPATPTAPAGRIIDDSSRGTIFWEVISEASTSGTATPSATSSSTAPTSPTSDTSVLKSWGTPFKVTWISTARVPFFKTKGLKNAWNANRDVKIARDGTELEPTVGHKLLQLFDGFSPTVTASPVVAGAEKEPPRGPIVVESTVTTLSEGAGEG